MSAPRLPVPNADQAEASYLEHAAVELRKSLIRALLAIEGLGVHVPEMSSAREAYMSALLAAGSTLSDHNRQVANVAIHLYTRVGEIAKRLSREEPMA